MRASGPLVQAIRAIGPSEESDMDLATRYLGLALRNPIIASASPLTGEVGTIRQLEDWGAGAVVLPSLFEEQIRQEEQLAEMLTSVGADSSPEASSYFPASTKYNAGPHGYLDLVARARAAVDIPVIASLNGTTEAGWVDYARLVEQAGAAALELNIYRIEVRPGMTGAEVDADCMRLFTAVRSRVAIPVSVKLHPCYSAFGALALQLDAAGADGLVLFNRVYQSDIDLNNLRWSNNVALSGAGEIQLGLLWLSLLAGRMQRASLAASTGVETADEVIKYLLAGADAVMTTSALLRHGPRHLRTLVASLEAWLSARGYTSVTAIRGLMRRTHPEGLTEVRGRSDYIQSLLGYRGPYAHR
jgi:dihydroorotate dehydrogenase (fumarate)